jgi:signal peptidase I
LAAHDAKPAQRRPWRDNLEAIVMAIVMAVMLKYFVVEAYQIPTGSMQPTLMGNDEAGIKDRIIVDKFSFHVRDPERFEVVVFRYPLDRSKNFIKRICGMPNEELRISLGDLWTRKSPDEPWKILRRPEPVQREVWKRIYPKDPRYSSWRPESGAKSWAIRGRDRIEARGDGTVRLPNDGGAVFDSYRDGYPGDMGDALSRARVIPAGHPVGDLRIEGDVRALPGCTSVVAELREGKRRYLFELPGPAAPEGATARIRTEGLAPDEKPAELEAKAAKPFRLRAGKSVSFAAQNMDDLLALEIDGEKVLELEIPPAVDQASCFQLRVEGEGADFSSLELYRDIFYLEDNRKSEFVIPDGCYVMLGDNTQDSSDSRFWTLTTMTGEDGQPVRGNYFPPQNPIQIPGDPRGARVFLRDEWGDLHTFMSTESATANLEWAPFVRRDMILGRAVAVFWPFSFKYKVWRLQWVH